MTNVFIVVISIAILLFLIFSKGSKSKLWNATLTPLASIIGSGFLILGPLLQNSLGTNALWGMASLCLISYLIGSGIRFNILKLEPLLEQKAVSKPILILEKLSDYALFLAYVISVCYYLNLFGAFFLKIFDPSWAVYGKHVTTAVLGVIGVFGILFGLSALEKLEKYSVSLKLSIISGLIVGLIFFNADALRSGSFVWSEPHIPFSMNSVFILLGLIITVQGFETSRYLGEEYDKQTRAKSMKLAQIVSSLIYILYIGLSMVNYAGPVTGSEAETAIIEQSAIIASILPVLLIVAALASQFSAAVADTNGGGGLFYELSHKKLSSKIGYIIIAGIGILTTWSLDIFQIIAIASKAFAGYYTLQLLESTLLSWKNKQYMNALYFGVISLTCSAIVIFGVPAE